MIDDLQIGRLRAPAVAGDLAARLRIERALAAADLRPADLPAGAVLIVRRLATPRPSSGPAWQHAARAQLAALSRQAARPAHDDSAADAEAVLFADAAELLGCLATDIVADAAASRWWWRCYLRGRPAGLAQLPHLLADAPAALPAALSMLAARGRAVAVLRALPPPAARALAEQIAATYAAGPLPLAQPDRPHTPASTLSLRHSGADPLAHQASAASPPWPTLPPELAREQQLLLGLALTIAARPAAPRASAFRRALAAWWQAADETAPSAYASTSDQQGAALPVRVSAAPYSASRPPVASFGDSSPQTTPDASFDAPQPEPHSGVPAQASAAPAQPAGPFGLPDPSDLILPETPAQAIFAQTPARSGQASSQPVAARATASPDQLLPAEIAPAHAAPPASALISAAESSSVPASQPASNHDALWPDLAGAHPTELGGALFLINLLIGLGLPEQFAPAWPLEQAVGAWGLLELFARGLLSRSDAYADDPLWGVLAQLDRRTPGAAPGAGYRPGRALRRARTNRRSVRPARAALDYCIPAAWLRALPDDPAERLRWAANRRHMRIWSSRGHVLFDGVVRRPGDAAARAILAGLGVSDLVREQASSPQSAPDQLLPTPDAVPAWLRRWLALSLPYARLRLALALGLDPADELEQPLLARRGTLYVSTTHIDLTLSLESTSIAVRLAGLDRNPGWIAEYGRVVLFHFVAPGEQEAS